MLKPAFREQAVKAPKHWQQLACGQWLKTQTEQELAPHCERLYGYHFARVGCLTAELELPKFAVAHQFSVAEQLHEQVQVQAKSTDWPFAEDALDSILMVGQLEFESDPHQVLRDVSRSLIADGKLIYVGFNPFSPNLLTGLWPGNRKRYPWSGRYFSKARLLDWLSLLNFEVTVQQYFAPSLLQQRWGILQAGMERIYKFIPQSGALYLVVAKKREFPLTLVSERHKHRQVRPNLQTAPLANQTQPKEY
ncbi:methyltransferase domain-containing protein [Pseudidiomarina sp. 1APP75-32.1]|uniref:Methyltransferase domain-containing protein n=1 Tax=Pseudidiomarina terrestris TaxID=2820060 RepID=A0AAW7QZW8_9GAMM|nr:MULTISPECIES: methyltransferase domain-containing protein [unclassified Pseudidiomarina]MDN7123910.1 methyltransferase domain-containing protein [Pseudidiomarina sp. 1APP75-32.1]MDN7127664.1 methyltransferase domain-containing protein [Pseudidiomarina sp. 1APR75-33.1]MDN7130410.1 methyltransferase domain-containing protein [Pseudidiomarina sp. 1APR75-15]